jgi:hypothetical protein
VAASQPLDNVWRSAIGVRDADDETGTRMIAFDYEHVTHVRAHTALLRTLVNGCLPPGSSGCHQTARKSAGTGPELLGPLTPCERATLIPQQLEQELVQAAL